MGLIGTGEFVTYYQSETEFTTETKTTPDGTTVEVQVPVEVRESVSFTDGYIAVIFVQHDQVIFDNVKHKMTPFRYALYADKASRYADQEGNVIAQGGEMVVNYDHELNTYAQCYDVLRAMEGFENLTND